MIKAILFDFWGTLVEQGVYPSPFKQARYLLRLKMPFSEFAPRFEKAFMLNKHDSLYDGFREVAKEFGVNPPDFVYDKLVGLWNKNKLLAKPYTETMDALTHLSRKYTLAIVSNTDCFSINEIVDKYDMRKFFDVISLSYETGLLKTDRKMFSSVLKKLRVKKEEAVMAGDSMESDIIGAEHAGVKAILVDRRDKRDYPNKVKGLDEIEDTIQNLK